jgi:hypothetical protein
MLIAVAIPSGVAALEIFEARVSGAATNPPISSRRLRKRGEVYRRKSRCRAAAGHGAGLALVLRGAPFVHRPGALITIPAVRGGAGAAMVLLRTQTDVALPQACSW